MKKTADSVSKKLAVLLLVFTMFGAVMVVDTEPAEAARSYNVYESRQTVARKAGWINLPARGCTIVSAGGTYLSGATGGLSALIGLGISAVCWGVTGTGNAGKAYDYAALRQCKMRVNITPTNSVYSWDKSVTKYYPYACRR